MIEITKHAYERAKERLSWSKSTLERMAERAWFDGINTDDVKGSLRHFINNKGSDLVNKSYYRIHGEYLFIFCKGLPGFLLVTLYKIPHDLVRLIPRR